MAPASREILVIGLNPAFQATLHFEHMRTGKVNRAFRKCNSIGGKGQNFAIACAQYGEGDRISVLQLVGGMTGRYIQAFLDEHRIEHISINTRKATRTCTTVLDKHTGEMTELIEPAARLEPREREQLEKTAREVITGSPKMEGMALCGTLPPGITGSIYAMAAQLKPPSVVLLLDAAQHAIECLNTGKVDILKINADEARYLINKDDSCELVDVGKQLYKMFRVRILAITNGPDEAYLFENKTTIHTPQTSPTSTITPTSPSTPTRPHRIHMTVYKIPALMDALADLNDIESSIGSSPLSTSLPEATGEPSPLLSLRGDLGHHPNHHHCHNHNQSQNQQQPTPNHHHHQSLSSMASNLSLRDLAKEIVINPLGAGDTCSAIFLLEYLDTQNAVMAYRHGLAAASASCLVVDYTSHFDVKVKKEIYDKIVCETVVIDVDCDDGDCNGDGVSVPPVAPMLTSATPVSALTHASPMWAIE